MRRPESVRPGRESGAARLGAQHQIRVSLERVRVTLRHSRIHAKGCADCEAKTGWIDHIDRDIELSGDLDDMQRQRLLQIAERCPVHQTLTSKVDIATSLS